MPLGGLVYFFQFLFYILSRFVDGCGLVSNREMNTDEKLRKNMIEPWERVESEQQGDYKVFRVRQDQRRSPQSGTQHTFYVIEAGDWVNIIPITPEGQVVCVRQFRHGIEDVTLEIPGGMIDPGETAAAAARREMREETGYDTEQIVYLGSIAPNPAILNNTCHTFLALEAHPDGPQRLEGTEDIEVVLVDLADVPALVVQGQMNHSLVVTGLYLYEHYKKGVKREA